MKKPLEYLQDPEQRGMRSLSRSSTHSKVALTEWGIALHHGLPPATASARYRCVLRRAVTIHSEIA